MAQAATTSTENKTPPSRRTLKERGRKKRKLKLATNPEFKKAYHEGKSKRSVEKKAAFRKKKKGKK